MLLKSPGYSKTSACLQHGGLAGGGQGPHIPGLAYIADQKEAWKVMGLRGSGTYSLMSPFWCLGKADRPHHSLAAQEGGGHSRDRALLDFTVCTVPLQPVQIHRWRMQAIQTIKDHCARGDFAQAQAVADQHSLFFNRYAQEPAYLVIPAAGLTWSI